MLLKNYHPLKKLQSLSKPQLVLPQTNYFVIQHFLLGIGLSITTSRLVFRLPVNGQRTWRNHKTVFKHIHPIIFKKLQVFNLLLGTSSQTLFFGEYLNLIYQGFFWQDWQRSNIFQKKARQKRLPININFCKFLYGTTTAMKNVTTINLGFKFGFIKKYASTLI